MAKKKLSNELISVFEYMRDVICKTDHPKAQLNEMSYLLAVLNCEDSLAYQALSSILMSSSLEDMKSYYDKTLTDGENDVNFTIVEPFTAFDKYFDDCEAICTKFNMNSVTSTVLLLSILKLHDNNIICENIFNKMREFSVTTVQIINAIKGQVDEVATSLPVPHKRTRKKVAKMMDFTQPIKIINGSAHSDNEISRYMVDYGKMSSFGEIQTIYGYDKYYKKVFTILSKKNRNNVAICGKSGVGKTAFVKNIANLINAKKCHKNFYNKRLVGLDFSKLVVGTQFKGAFEQKFYSLLEDAKKDGNYIFFIDNIQFLVNGNTKYAETDMESLLETLLTEPSIQTICTTTVKDFTKLQKKSIIGKYLQDVIIEEPTNAEALEIIDAIKSQFESFHDVIYEEEALKTCITLCKKYMTNRALPDSAMDLMDMVGAQISIGFEENPKVKILRDELSNITNQISDIKSSSETKQYDKIDELVKQQISIKSQIGIIEKEDILSKTPSIITKNDICSVLSAKIDVPLEDLTSSEKERLRGLNAKLKNVVIGQDEAVDEVCRAVKRQRVGLGEKNRPSVMMFLGGTGTGKTYLAKQLAKEVFGNEKYFVRMDMSEYSDKTSVNKIGGSSPGYVGYDNDTLLVRALKRKKRFVLLLDEFEKSNEEVHNLFLQMFDEGRFTDNHGEAYNLKDVIIIMTSNVGVSEAANRGRTIGFGTNETNFTQSIIEKELKKKFKPEFLNRIQKIVYFNNLDENGLKQIINLEIQKINQKVENLGYRLSDDITQGKMVDDIYDAISSKTEYGARPIVNEVQRNIEDKIVDCLIDNDVEEGHIFTYNELSNLD
jgi:ATP-dependent Clp protease ATP-binding subunit ClpC